MSKPTPLNPPVLIVPNIKIINKDIPPNEWQEVTLFVEDRLIRLLGENHKPVYEYKLPVTEFLVLKHGSRNIKLHAKNANGVYTPEFVPYHTLNGNYDLPLEVPYESALQINEFFYEDALTQTQFISTYIKQSIQTLEADEEFSAASANFFSSYCESYFSDFLFLQSIFNTLWVSEEYMNKAYPLIHNFDQLRLFKNSTNVNNFIDSDFRNFVKLIQELLPDFTYYTTFAYLLDYSKSFFAAKWRQSYKDLFNPLRETAAEWLDTFCNLPDIDPQDPQTQTTFYFFMLHEGKKTTGEPFFDDFIAFFELLKKVLDTKQFNNFKTKLTTIKHPSQSQTIDDIDIMTGEEFEHFIATLFARMGYSTQVTQLSGDQGIDVIAEKDGKKLGIQAKCYSGSVGNSAIQEAAAGKAHYNLDKVLVITNNYFTDSARQLAASNNVVLWDRTLLKEKIC